MSVRSPGILVIALLSLTASAVLGGLLVHDGEIGTDHGLLFDADKGDTLRLKGDLHPAHSSRHQVDGLDHLARMVIDGFEAPILVIADFALPQEGSWVVTAQVHSAYDDNVGAPPVLQALEVTAPIVFS